MPLGKAFEPKHMYHADLPAKICYTSDQVAASLAQGYSENYIPQEFPKAVFVTHDGAGNEITDLHGNPAPIGVKAVSPEHEQSIRDAAEKAKAGKPGLCHQGLEPTIDQHISANRAVRTANLVAANREVQTAETGQHPYPPVPAVNLAGETVVQRGTVPEASNQIASNRIVNDLK